MGSKSSVCGQSIPTGFIEQTLRERFGNRFDFEVFLDALEQLQPLARPQGIDDSVQLHSLIEIRRSKICSTSCHCMLHTKMP